MFAQIKIERDFTHRNLTWVSSRTSDRYSPAKKASKAGIKLLLVQLSKRHRRYAVEVENRRIGIIKAGIGNWIARADLQFGASETQEKTPTLALIWLVENYKKVKRAGIKFFASQDLYHYNIENENWLIKISLTPEDCVATINHKNNLDFEYFPDPHSAIRFSFDLILNRSGKDLSTNNSEF